MEIFPRTNSDSAKGADAQRYTIDEERAASSQRKVIRLLIVDDYQPLRRLAAAWLGSAEMTVVGEASNGEEAIDASLILKPDVVLMDYQMPCMDGLTAAGLLKQLPAPPRIVMWTSEAWGIERAALRAGVDAVLQKGCSWRQLCQALTQAGSERSILEQGVAVERNDG